MRVTRLAFLGLCAVAGCGSSGDGDSFGATMGQGQFSTSGRCVVELGPDCTVGTDYVVDLTIGNKTAGVTVATVKLHAGP